MSLKPPGIVLDLIKLLGYSKMDEEVYAFVGDYFSALIQGTRLIEDQAMRLKMLSMSEEDRKKQEGIFKAREEFLAKKKIEMAEKKRLEEISHMNRRVKA